MADFMDNGGYGSDKIDAACMKNLDQLMSTDNPKSQLGEPIWEIATLFPPQGQWTADEYLGLQTNRLVEFDDGKLEFLPAPTELHQLIAFYLCTLLRNLGSGDPPGLALMSPFRVKVSESKFREPDVLFMLDENRNRRNNQFWDGADLVVEVVSDDDPNRDFQIKKKEYAEAGITEYWIVDPRDRSISVLALDAGKATYRISGRYEEGQIAKSVLLTEFEVSVKAVFDQPQS